MIVTLYSNNKRLHRWWRKSTYSSLGGIPQDILDLFGRDIYNTGYLSVTPLNRNGTEWYRCDLIPVREAEVPKELLLLELINPP